MNNDFDLFNNGMDEPESSQIPVGGVPNDNAGETLQTPAEPIGYNPATYHSEARNTPPQNEHAPSEPAEGSYHYYYGVRAEGPGSPYGYAPRRETVDPREDLGNPPGYSGRYDAPQESQKTRKKKSGVGMYILVAVLCLILGAGIGGGAFFLLSGNENAVVEADTVPEEVTDPQLQQDTLEVGGEAAVQDENTAFNSTTIEITTNSTSTSMTPQSVYEHYVNSVVAIANEGTATNIFGYASPTASSGSGMIISQDGYILTNNHVVEGAEKLTVTMTSGEEYEATLIGTDSDNDVALIKIEGENFPTVSIGDSDSIQVGEQLCAIGNPLGELTNTLTVGYVSALDREINENGIPINMFQTDCAINSGNSGGPIFDMNGNVVGITTAKYSSGSSSGASIEGIGFCIPINDAMEIVNDLLQYGYGRGRVSMGIMCQAISSTVTQYYNLPAGIYVSTVEPGSAAENAGIKEGDIICAIEGVEVTSVTELKVKLKEYKPGDTATLTIYDNMTHETKDVPITFDEMVASSTQEQQSQEEEQPQQEQRPDVSISPYFPFG